MERAGSNARALPQKAGHDVAVSVERIERMKP
jgi:hypothetical protein